MATLMFMAQGDTNQATSRIAIDSANLEASLLGNIFPLFFEAQTKEHELQFVKTIGDPAIIEGGDDFSGEDAEIMLQESTVPYKIITHSGLIRKSQLVRQQVSEQAMRNVIIANSLYMLTTAHLWGYGCSQGLFNIQGIQSRKADFNSNPSIEKAVLSARDSISEAVSSNPDLPYLLLVPTSWQEKLDSSYNPSNQNLQNQTLREVLQKKKIYIQVVKNKGEKKLEHPVLTQLLPENAYTSISTQNYYRTYHVPAGLKVEINMLTTLPLFGDKGVIVNILPS